MGIANQKLSKREIDALHFVSEALVKIRLLATREGNLKRIHALADSVHNTPSLIARGDEKMYSLLDLETRTCSSILNGNVESN